MSAHFHEHKSLWINTVPSQAFPHLEGDLDVDVAIIGGGITGITSALLLQRAGKRVAVIEALRVGEGVTGYTTAHITEALDARYQTLVKKFGLAGARLAAGSQRDAKLLIERIVRQEELDCGFTKLPGYLYTERREDLAMIEEEAAAAERIGLDVELTNDIPLPFPTVAAAKFNDQAAFHPRKYIMPLARKIVDRGGRVFEGTRVLEVEDGEPARLVTERGIVTARDVIVATHSPVSNILYLHTKLYQYRSYVVALRLRKGSPFGLFWDSDDPYHYVRTDPAESGDVLIVGGEDHKVGIAPENDTRKPYEALEEWARERFGAHSVEYRWSAQVVETADGLPYIGLNSASKHIWVATGFAGNGMTCGTVAAILLTDLITGQPNPWAELFDATRLKPLAAAGRFIKENVDFPVHFVKDRLGIEKTPVSEIGPGEGKIIKVNGEKLAISRSETGEVCAVSPVCTHMGCFVGWNTAEKTWDCPCHGSRFKPTGEVIDGPAIAPLERKTVVEDRAPAKKGTIPDDPRAHPHPERERST
jgi:glycine/D-amino acid oxidase-like deaminating enzyme/nitrite reductase/ring-hydroxylating ferredoxin subunit